MHGGSALKLWAMAVLGVAVGLIFLILPRCDPSPFAKLTHLTGRVEEFRRVSAPDRQNPAFLLTLSDGVGRYTIRIDTYDWHPVTFAGLSLGAVLEVWVDTGPRGEMFAWQVERDGEVLVGYRDRLETSRRLQLGLEWVGLPFLAAGVLLSLLAISVRCRCVANSE